jgi:hypothetical protein
MCRDPPLVESQPETGSGRHPYDAAGIRQDAVSDAGQVEAARPPVLVVVGVRNGARHVEIGRIEERVAAEADLAVATEGLEGPRTASSGL